VPGWRAFMLAPVHHRRELIEEQSLLELWASVVTISGLVSSWLYIMKHDGGTFLSHVLEEQVGVWCI
jgi:hypothetical protein